MRQASKFRLLSPRSWAQHLGRRVVLGIGLLILLGSLCSSAAYAGQTDPPAVTHATEDTALVSTTVAQTATLEFGHGMLDEPLVVFYEPGAQAVVAPGSYAGPLVMDNAAGLLIVVPCPALDPPPPLMAVCLDATDLGNRTGVYEGTATVLQPNDVTAGDKSGPPPGSVKVSVTVRRHWGLFVLVALIGTLLSLAAIWYVTEYQQIRKLRWTCAGLPATPLDCAACDPPRAASSLRLEGVDDLVADAQCDLLRTNAGNLWIRSLIGERPDYAAIEKAIAQVHNAQAQFCALCDLYVALAGDLGQVIAASGKMGGAGQPRLQTILTAAMRTTTVQAGAIEDQLAAWRDLHALTQQWRGLAQHIIDLRLWNDEVTAQAGGDLRLAEDVEQPEMPEDLAGQQSRLLCSEQATHHIDAARHKLAAITSAEDLEILRPDKDIRAAWWALASLDRRSSPAQQFTLFQMHASVGASTGGVFGAGSLVAGIGQWVRALVDGWSPQLNRAMIWLLFLISLGVTIFAGSQVLYVGKPWGTASDIFFLLVIGTGIHAGLTGLAGAISTRKPG